MRSDLSDFQQRFLQRLQTKFDSRGELVASLVDTLQVGRDAIYRRLRGDTALTANELVLLSRHYRVPIDEGRNLEDIPVLHYHSGANQIESDESYFRQLRSHTQGIVSLPNPRVDYATPELPIFYEFGTPVLRAFKVFVYGTTTWRLKKWDDVPFSPALISPQTTKLIEGVLDDAGRIPGRELWSINILDVTLRQVAYMAQIGRFANTADLSAIFEELHLIIDHLEEMVRTGKRYPIGGEPTDESPDFSVYHNELSNTNNAILVRSDISRLLFSTLVNPNYVTSTDPRVLHDVQQWFDRLVENSNTLNNQTGKYTNQYFGRLRQQVDAARERVTFANVIF